MTNSKVVSECWTELLQVQVNTTPSSWSAEKCARKTTPTVLFSAHLVTTSQDQGYWKWCKMVKVNGAYKHGIYERIWFNSLQVMFYIKVLPCKADGIQQDWSHRSLSYSHGQKKAGILTEFTNVFIMKPHGATAIVMPAPVVLSSHQSTVLKGKEPKYFAWFTRSPKVIIKFFTWHQRIKWHPVFYKVEIIIWPSGLVNLWYFTGQYDIKLALPVTFCSNVDIFSSMISTQEMKSNTKAQKQYWLNAALKDNINNRINTALLTCEYLCTSVTRDITSLQQQISLSLSPAFLYRLMEVC